MTRRIALAASVALVLVLAVVSPALADKGGKRAAGSRATTGAKITFDPASVLVGQQYRVNGSGFRANTWVTVGARFPDTTWWNSCTTDSQGRFSLTFTATGAGQIYHEAKEQGKSGRLRLKATATLTVNPAP